MSQVLSKEEVQEFGKKIKKLGVLKKTEQLQLIATLEDCYAKLDQKEKEMGAE